MILSANGFADGTVGQITVDLLISGSAEAGYGGTFWDGILSWSTSASVNGQSSTESFSGHRDGDVFVTGGSAFGLRQLTFDVVFGQAAGVVLRVDTYTSANAGGLGVNFADLAADLGHTVAWNGISRLTVDGREIGDFTAYSPDTGFDFVRGYGAPTGAVPEPGVWALMIAGFGLAGAALRRREAARPLRV